jgi:hypothetical protein
MILKWVDERGKNVNPPSARLLIRQNKERRDANLAGTGSDTEVFEFGRVALAG